jgi:CMP-N-acetylneuraminic acid synthetase
MYKGKTFFAIIPARGGSKRLPRKNILNLAGKPLIAWTIEAAQKSKYIDRIIVSTDDLETEAIAVSWGAEVIKRPAALATDTSTSVDVVLHAISQVNAAYDYVLLLQPTSPLRNKSHIDSAIELLLGKSADAIISVSEAEHNPLWCNTIPRDGSMHSFLKEKLINKRSQDLPKYYRVNGAIYLCDSERVFRERSLFIKDNVFAYIMDRTSSVDIDEQFDFNIATTLLEMVQN